MRPGEVQRWRMVNGTFEETITLSLLPEGGTTALPLTVLCTDGNPLSKATSVSSLYLAGGNRADVLVKAPSQPGTYQLHYGYTDKNKQPATQKAMTIKVEGPAKEMPLFAGRLPSVPLLKPIVDSEIVRTRTLTYGLNSDKLFTVNGVTFGSDQPQQDVILGTAEEWTITDTTGFPHSFHIHVNPFQATSSPVHPIIEPGQWLDTIEVPPNGSVTFRTRFTDYTGTFVLHCHYLPHEDAGLMQVVNVLPPTSAK
jgi:FtsP/CotA-like multicopper oxidase with cupredoxin domain